MRLRKTRPHEERLVAVLHQVAFEHRDAAVRNPGIDVVLFRQKADSGADLVVPHSMGALIAAEADGMEIVMVVFDAAEFPVGVELLEDAPGFVQIAVLEPMEKTGLVRRGVRDVVKFADGVGAIAVVVEMMRDPRLVVGYKAAVVLGAGGAVSVVAGGYDGTGRDTNGAWRVGPCEEYASRARRSMLGVAAPPRPAVPMASYRNWSAVMRRTFSGGT